MVDKNKKTKEYENNLSLFKHFQYAHLTEPPANLDNKEAQIMEIMKCKYNIIYFLKYYAKMPSTGGGLTPLIMNNKTMTVALLFQASVKHIFQTARQSTKTTIELFGAVWYNNFWKNTRLMLMNMKKEDNRKNLYYIRQYTGALPAWMRAYDPSKHVNNVEKLINGLDSQVYLLTVDRESPGSSGRGNTGSIIFDEFGFIKNIHIAFSPISFVYSNYSRIALKNYAPAPFGIVSTPADPNSDEGALFMKFWNQALEVSYDEIKDMLPHEIKEYVEAETRRRNKDISKESEKLNGFAKVFQYWFEYPDRCEPNLYDENNPENIRHLLDDPFVDLEELIKFSAEAVKYLSEMRTLCTSKTQLRREVYCEFLSTADQTIFDEDFLASLERCQPLKKIAMPYTISGTLDIYTDVKADEDHRKIAISVDPAYRVKGDFAAITVFDVASMEIIATAKLKLGKINNLVEVVKFVFSLFPESVIIIEKNNFGQAVIERLLEIPYIARCMFFTYGNKKVKNMSMEKRADNRVYGIQTDSGSRPKMLQMLIKYVLDNPDKLKSNDLISELTYLQEKKNGRVEAASGYHDDLVMSLAFILYLIEYKMQDLQKFLRISSNCMMQYHQIVSLNDNSKLESSPYGGFIRNMTKLGYDKSYQSVDDNYNLDDFKKELDNRYRQKNNDFISMFVTLNNRQ